MSIEVYVPKKRPITLTGYICDRLYSVTGPGRKKAERCRQILARFRDAMPDAIADNYERFPDKTLRDCTRRVLFSLIVQDLHNLYMTGRFGTTLRDLCHQMPFLPPPPYPYGKEPEANPNNNAHWVNVILPQAFTAQIMSENFGQGLRHVYEKNAALSREYVAYLPTYTVNEYFVNEAVQVFIACDMIRMIDQSSDYRAMDELVDWFLIVKPPPYELVLTHNEPSDAFSPLDPVLKSIIKDYMMSLKEVIDHLEDTVPNKIRLRLICQTYYDHAQGEDPWEVHRDQINQLSFHDLKDGAIKLIMEAANRDYLHLCCAGTLGNLLDTVTKHLPISPHRNPIQFDQITKRLSSVMTEMFEDPSQTQNLEDTAQRLHETFQHLFPRTCTEPLPRHEEPEFPDEIPDLISSSDDDYSPPIIDNETKPQSEGSVTEAKPRSPRPVRTFHEDVKPQAAQITPVLPHPIISSENIQTPSDDLVISPCSAPDCRALNKSVRQYEKSYYLKCAGGHITIYHDNCWKRTFPADPHCVECTTDTDLISWSLRLNNKTLHKHKYGVPEVVNPEPVVVAAELPVTEPEPEPVVVRPEVLPKKKVRDNPAGTKARKRAERTEKFLQRKAVESRRAQGVLPRSDLVQDLRRPEEIVDILKPEADPEPDAPLVRKKTRPRKRKELPITVHLQGGEMNLAKVLGLPSSSSSSEDEDTEPVKQVESIWG